MSDRMDSRDKDSSSRYNQSGGNRRGGYNNNNNNSSNSNSRGGFNNRRPGGAGGNSASPFFQARRKVCPVRIEEIDWKKVDSLRYFIGERGEIRPRRKTGANAKLQRRAAQAIKRARHMALLPYTGEHIRLMRNQRD